MKERLQTMTQAQELVRRISQHSTNSLAKASGLSRPSIAAIKTGATKDMKFSTVEKLTAALTTLEKAPGKAAPKRRVLRGSAGTANKASRKPSAGSSK
jgi:predicted transcriptional regulator